MNKIILIEDNDVNQRLVSLYLQDTTIELDIACDYDEFSKKFEKGKYDAAIIELSSKDEKDRKDIFNFIKESDENVKIIIISVDEEEKNKYLEKDDVFLPKPFLGDKLIKTFESLLNKKIY